MSVIIFSLTNYLSFPLFSWIFFYEWETSELEPGKKFAASTLARGRNQDMLEFLKNVSVPLEHIQNTVPTVLSDVF